ncbi:hypothetical protein GGR53DRAFT_23918 [Hypoxylon sp. FL1150]|nr:hypothetical protein GGR53DRAFT_23918 [Hypoxylon sp. FL1150]
MNDNSAVDTVEAQPSQGRPYRSKRHRPCDICRRRKQACCLEDAAPCRLCQELRTPCTFNDPPSKRRRNEVPSPARTSGFDTHLRHSRASVPPSRSRTSPLAVQTRSRGNGNEPRVIDAFDAEDGSEGAEPDASGQDGVVDPSWAMGDPEMAETSHTANMNACPNPQMGGVDKPDRLMQPSTHDMWYLASLWDPTASGSVLHTMPNSMAGGRDASNFQSDNFFPMLDLSATSPALPSSRQSGIQESTTPGSASVEIISHDADIHKQSSQPTEALEQECPNPYLGLLSDLDPCLLQHMQFSSEGIFNFRHYGYRRLTSGLESNGSRHTSTRPMPAYFLMGKRTQDNGDVAMTAGGATPSRDLETLITPEVGPRLIGLFLRYVFPGLPVISRSRLKIRTKTLIPPPEFLGIFPQYLLAAIYASVHEFRRYDPLLCIQPVTDTSLVPDLWRIAYDGINQNIHAPQLALLQTILICLQRPNEKTRPDTTDRPREWALLSSAVNVAYQLGLHVDCDSWPIPGWQQRLRRRLWWVTYSEATWRTLLLGLPQSIPLDQWDVSPLVENDFFIDDLRVPSEESCNWDPAHQELCQFCHLGFDFRFMAGLSSHASNLYKDMYTVAAIRRRSGDFRGTLAIGVRLLAQLRDWKKDLPPHMATHGLSNIGEHRDYYHPGSATNIKLAYLTIEVLIYRAVLRSLPAAETPSYPGSEVQDQQSQRGEDLVLTLETYRGALEVAQRVSNFVQRIGPYDRNSLYYTWAQDCFSIISNFVLLLLVQAPTADLAKEVLTLLARWVIVLREQCILFDQMEPALVRLDIIFDKGMENVFHFSPHVKEAVEAELPMRLYKN